MAKELRGDDRVRESGAPELDLIAGCAGNGEAQGEGAGGTRAGREARSTHVNALTAQRSVADGIMMHMDFTTHAHV